VAGFQNLGVRADDNFNIILTKSLINYLSRLSDVSVVSYDTVERTVAANGFWKTTVFDIDVIDSMGLGLNVQKVVFGNYQVDNATKTITVKYFIYNTADGQTVLARNLDGPAGIDVFDTIDAMAKKIAVAVVNRDVDFAALVTPTIVTNQSVVTVTNNSVVTNNSGRQPAGPRRAR
jgi:TolB-like protein